MDNKDKSAEELTKEEAQNIAEQSSEAESEAVDTDEFTAETDAEGVKVELSREELITELAVQQEKVAELDAEVDDLLGRLQRLQADFVNYRKRSQKEKAEMVTKGKIDLCFKMLPVIDNFERALNSEEVETEFAKGVQMIYNQLLKVFADQGIEEIEAAGKEFDPEFHEAIMRVEAEAEESGTVVEVLQKGFILADRVIRPARVKVAV